MIITIIIAHVIIKSPLTIKFLYAGFAAFQKMYSQIRAKRTALQFELAVRHPHSPELLY